MTRIFGAPTRLLVLFVVVAGLPLAAMGWLGWRLLEQDHALERQRIRERLENGASLLARECDRALAKLEVFLTESPGREPELPAGSTLLVFDAKGIVRRRGVSLPYYPAVDNGSEASGTIFAQAEAQEFRQQSLANAESMYRKLCSSTDRGQRAGALMRLARCLRKQHRFQDALHAYDNLAAMGDTVVAGAPTEFLARNERIAMLNLAGNQQQARREADLLSTALQEGRFRIDRATFDFYSKSAHLAPRTPPDVTALADAVQQFWPRWREQATGRAAVRVGDATFATVWRASESSTVSVTGRIDELLAPVLPLARDLQVKLLLEDSAGQLLYGQLLSGTRAGPMEQAAKSFHETGLPWTIRVAADPVATQRLWESRRNLFSAGLGLMALVIAAAAYFVFRAVHRELGVARLQSDFVSTVSHEFRTPLTAMCHLTEMLEEGGAPPERLPQYYRALAKETRRLHGMVESLLDFGRIEAGRRTYRMQETDAAELVRQVVDEFRERAGSPDRLALHAPPDPYMVHADHEAIALALRNLLDNACKYSPESSPIDVSLAPCGEFAGITVEDRGPGIPKDEQRAVFRKFVRGESARTLNVKGTGIGLALADHIVKAHGGRLELASEPGHGSRFTILLPAGPNI